MSPTGSPLTQPGGEMPESVSSLVNKYHITNDLTLYHTIPTFNDPKKDSFGKHWEKEKMLVTNIFSFSRSLFYSIKERNHLILIIFSLSSAKAFNLNKSNLLTFGKELTLSQTIPGFYVSSVKVFLKTQWEKEKLLMRSNFAFYHSVFYPFGDLSVIFIKFEIVICKLFQFGRV